MNLPAYVTGRRWDILLWNTAAAEILKFDTRADPDRNILVFMFIGLGARRLFGRTWTDEADVGEREQGRITWDAASGNDRPFDPYL
jgi:hypothetical protein